VERDYTDRHFIEEFSAYCATKFRSPRATCYPSLAAFVRTALEPLVHDETPVP
jgi:hypothetical protein